MVGNNHSIFNSKYLLIMSISSYDEPKYQDADKVKVNVCITLMKDVTLETDMYEPIIEQDEDSGFINEYHEYNTDFVNEAEEQIIIGGKSIKELRDEGWDVDIECEL